MGDQEAFGHQILVGEGDGITGYVKRFGQLAAGGQRAAGGDLPLQNRRYQHLPQLHLQRGFAVSAEVEKGVAHLSGAGVA